MDQIPGLGRSPGGRNGNPLQYSCLENPHGWRSLADYSPWGCKESDMTEQISTAHNGSEELMLLKCSLFKANYWFNVSSAQISHSVVSDFLQPHGLQHARPPCPSPTPRFYPNSCPLGWWCHPNISSSVIPFSSHLQSFPVSGQCNSYQNSNGIIQ